MALCKISITLLGALISLVAGDFRFQHFKTFGFNGNADNTRQPWFADDYPGGSYRSESRIIPTYAGSSKLYDNLKHGTNPIPSIIGTGIKKVPKENKALKKAISPFYSLSDSDDPKYKEMILKSGAPYCQEINPKDRKTDVKIGVSGDKQITCYRCKDPKNGATYEHCSYSSEQPRSNFREARSNAAKEKTLDNLSAADTQYKDSSEPTTEKLSESFRFSDDYFQPEPSHELPAQYEKNIDNCERVVKNSMICMVCKDPKTSGKYEQCSYVARPNEKAYAYTKSSSFGPKKNKERDQARKEDNKKTKKVSSHRKEDDDEQESEPERRYENREPEELSEPDETERSETEAASAEDREGHGTHYVPDHTYHYPSHKDYKSNYDNYDAEEEEEDLRPKQSSKSTANCKTLEKDGQTCTMCTNPKTGGKSEKCNYSHEPKDKVYRYTKSKSFGYPESQRSTGGESEDDADHEKTVDSSDKQERESSADDYGSYDSEPSTLDYIRSESEKISEKVKGKGDCHKVKKDSMVCTICKDPKTGGDFEQCNYSYDPDDKVYAYSKSTSFGSPTKTSGEDDYGSSSAEEHPEETYSAPIIYPTGTSPLDYIPKSDRQSSNIYTTKKPQVQNEEKQEESQNKASKSGVDSGFYDAKVRRAEIERIVKDIGAEDRSKCKKVIRGGMTCYRCTDNKGLTNEECVYVTDPEVEATKVEGVQVKDTKTTVETTVKPTNSSSVPTTTPTAMKLLEPLTSINWKSTASNRKTREVKEKANDQDEEPEVLEEEHHEAEPYDYVAETRPVYDKVLGITLPAYMLQKSSHELEFDAMVENSKI